MQKWMPLVALVVLPCFVRAQNAPPPAAAPTMKQVLSGSTFPITIKMKEMKPEEWRRFSVPGGSDGGVSSLMSMMALGGMGANGGGDDPPPSETIYYTKGDLVALGSETYLIAYRPLLKQPDMTALMLESERNPGKPPAPEKMMAEKMTTETSVAMALLNVKTLTKISDIKPFDFKQEIADNEAAGKALFNMVQAGFAAQNAAMGGAAAAEPEKRLVAPKVRAAIAADKTLTAEGNTIAVEEGESLITLRGSVKNETVKKHADDVVKKLFKEQGLGFKLDNQLETQEKETAKPAARPKAATTKPKATQKKP